MTKTWGSNINWMAPPIVNHELPMGWLVVNINIFSSLTTHDFPKKGRQTLISWSKSLQKT